MRRMKRKSRFNVQGFAFGPGLERVIMVQYGIPDVRLFHSGDVRFVFGFDASLKAYLGDLEAARKTD